VLVVGITPWQRGRTPLKRIARYGALKSRHVQKTFGSESMEEGGSNVSR
jgi:hypothetical protein